MKVNKNRKPLQGYDFAEQVQQVVRLAHDELQAGQLERS